MKCPKCPNDMTLETITAQRSSAARYVCECGYKTPWGDDPGEAEYLDDLPRNEQKEYMEWSKTI